MKDHLDHLAQLVFLAPPAFKDPQAPPEILVRGVLLVVLVCLVPTVWLGPLAPC